MNDPFEFPPAKEAKQGTQIEYLIKCLQVKSREVSDLQTQLHTKDMSQKIERDDLLKELYTLRNRDSAQMEIVWQREANAYFSRKKRWWQFWRWFE